MTAISRSRWLLRRLLTAIPVVIGVMALTFVLLHLAPGDPIYVLAGDGGDAAYYSDMRARYGLDRPLIELFARYARLVSSGDLGYSLMYQAPVGRVIAEHAPASLLLGVAALALATSVGFAIGVAGAVASSRFVDAAVRVIASVA
jgi:peptide/nickel transport system permease protein